MPQFNKLLYDYLDQDTKVEIHKDVYQVTKKNASRNKDIPAAVWVLKKSDALASIHVFASELYRLWSSAQQPRTELVVDNPALPANYYVLRRAIAGFRPGFSHPEVEVLLQSKKTPGLASLLVISLLLGLSRLSDVGVTGQNEFITRNNDTAFCLFWKDMYATGCSYDITTRDLQILPLITDYSPHQWLNCAYLNENGLIIRDYPEVLIAIKNDRAFLKEKYQTLLRIILTPESVLDNLATVIGDIPLRVHVLELLKARMQTLEQEALLIPEFRKFLFLEDLTLRQHFALQLERFPQLNYYETMDKIDIKFFLISLPQSLESYVARFGKEFQKKLLVNMAFAMISDAHSLDEVLDVVKNLRELPKYLNIKMRSRNYRLSFLGHHDAGQEVSATFSSLIKAAKNQMLRIAYQQAYADNNTPLILLTTTNNDYYDFIHTQRYRIFKTRTATEAMSIHALKMTKLQYKALLELMDPPMPSENHARLSPC